MKIAIIGSGYVGLPLAIAFSKKFSVVCYDIDKNRIDSLKNGNDFNKQHSKKEILKNKIIFTNNVNLIQNKDIFIITVPTPVNKKNNPDLKMLKLACKFVGTKIKKNSHIVFESTTYPGCTENICIPILEKYSRLVYEKDFFVSYSPERVNPGDRINTLANITKIVGSNNFKTLKIIKKLYQSICKHVYLVRSIKIAESAKVIENIQRDINIALVNEFSILFNKLKIPTNDVLKAAATKWNFHYYTPGLVGGHCISVDPYYLAYQAKKINYFPKLLLAGRNINESISRYVATQTIKLFSNNNFLYNRDVAILGFAFKDNIPDFRNTKVIDMIKKFSSKKIKFKVFDSLVSKTEVKKKYKIKIYNFKEMKKYKFDAIILAVTHSEFVKKITYYNQFYKDKKNKIFIDIKNKYLAKDLKKNNYKTFQL